MTLRCPDCGGIMSLKPSRFGLFYGCGNWPMCDCTHGAHPDGRPLGIPATRKVRELRMKVHALFDPLWLERGKRAREGAYLLLQRLMDMEERDCHIARFNGMQCYRALKALKRYLRRNNVGNKETTP